jgi:hypothetical protein
MCELCEKKFSDGNSTVLLKSKKVLGWAYTNEVCFCFAYFFTRFQGHTLSVIDFMYSVCCTHLFLFDLFTNNIRFYIIQSFYLCCNRCVPVTSQNRRLIFNEHVRYCMQ